MKSLVRLLAVTIALAFISHSASAKIFRNSYVSFELPPGWDCQLEGTEWVCRSTKADQAKESIIILTAKEAGPKDNLQAYETHLKTPRVINNSAGKPEPSKIIQVSQRTINQQVWVDGMHLASEVPNYYTRYLATVKDRIAVLVTFSAHKNQYTKYSNDFFHAILSLHVVADKGATGDGANSGAVGGPLLPKGHEILGPGSSAFPPDMLTDLPDEQPQRRFSGTTWFAILVLILAVAGYIYLRSQRKKK